MSSDRHVKIAQLKDVGSFRERLDELGAVDSL